MTKHWKGKNQSNKETGTDCVPIDKPAETNGIHWDADTEFNMTISQPVVMHWLLRRHDRQAMNL